MSANSPNRSVAGLASGEREKSLDPVVDQEKKSQPGGNEIRSEKNADSAATKPDAKVPTEKSVAKNVDRKIKSDTVIDIDDNGDIHAGEGRGQEEPNPSLLKQNGNNSSKPTRTLAEGVIINVSLPTASASNKQLLDGFQRTGRPFDPRRLTQIPENSDEEEKESKTVENALHSTILPSIAPILTSSSSNAHNESQSTQNVETSDKSSRNSQSSEENSSSTWSSKTVNKVVPLGDGGSQANSNGSRNSSRLANFVNGNWMRRGSYSLDDLTWAVARMLLNPAASIKSTPESRRKPSISLRDVSSSSSEQEDKASVEIKPETDLNKISRETQTESEIEDDVVQNEPQAGPSRLSKVASLEGPEVITPDHFVNELDSETQDEENGQLTKKESENAEEMEKNEESLRSEPNDVNGYLSISRGTQTDHPILESQSQGISSPESGEGSQIPNEMHRCGFLNNICSCRGKEQPSEQQPVDCPSNDEVHDPRPFPGSAAISAETTTTFTQTEAPNDTKMDGGGEISSERNAAFTTRIFRFFRGQGKKYLVSDVENQMENADSTANPEPASSRANNFAGIATRKKADKNKRDAEAAVHIEMEVVAPGKRNDDDKKNAKTVNGKGESLETAIEKEESSSPKKDGQRHEAVTTKATTNKGGNNLSLKVPVSQQNKDGWVSMSTSNRATQTEQNPTAQTIPGSVGKETTENAPRHGICSRVFDYFSNRICGKSDVNQQLEEVIKCDAKLGFSTFTVNEDGDLENSGRRKAMFIFMMAAAIFNVWKEIWKIVWYIKQKPEDDHTFYYLLIAFQAAILLLLVGHFVLIWWRQKVVKKAVKTLRRTRAPRKNKSRFSARKLRVYSLVVSALLILSGTTSLNEAKEYSPKNVWESHENDLYKSLAPGTYNAATANPPTTEAPNTTTTPALTYSNFTKTTWLDNGLNFTSTVNCTEPSKPPPKTPGLFLNDGHMETWIVGSISMVLSFIGEITFSSAPDWLLVIDLIIWHYVDSALDVEELALVDEDGNPLTPEEIRRRKVLAKAILLDHDDILELSSDLNEVGKIIWPALVLTAIFMSSYIIHLWFLGQWFKSIYYFIHLTKILTILFYGLCVSEKADRFYDWFVSKAGRELLDFDSLEFERRQAEFKRRPISFGMGPTITNLKFIFSLLGMVSSTLVLLVQSFFSGSRSTA